MNNVANSILEKTQRKGLKWLARRLYSEFHVPETELGEVIHPIFKFVFSLTTFCFTPVKSILFRNQESSNILYLVYDYEMSPVTYDISLVLCLAEQERIRLNLKHIQIVFVPGSYYGLRLEAEDYEKVVNKDLRHWQQYNLLIPITRLLPSCIGIHHCGSRKMAQTVLARKKNIFPKNYHSLLPLPHNFSVFNSLKFQNIQALTATEQSLNFINNWLCMRSKGRKVVVITLRQYDYMPCRNSNIEAWSKFINVLDQEQFFIVIVPDTHKAMDEPNVLFEKYQHFSLACWNVELRAALYQAAYLNLGINNGPFALCWLNPRCRYIMFKIITEKAPQTSSRTFNKRGFEIGEKPKFLKKYQKWVWEDDDETVILREFETMCLVIDAHLLSKTHLNASE